MAAACAAQVPDPFALAAVLLGELPAASPPAATCPPTDGSGHGPVSPPGPAALASTATEQQAGMNLVALSAAEADSRSSARPRAGWIGGLAALLMVAASCEAASLETVPLAPNHTTGPGQAGGRRPEPGLPAVLAGCCRPAESGTQADSASAPPGAKGCAPAGAPHHHTIPYLPLVSLRPDSPVIPVRAAETRQRTVPQLFLYGRPPRDDAPLRPVALGHLTHEQRSRPMLPERLALRHPAPRDLVRGRPPAAALSRLRSPRVPAPSG
ncbi:hypothetical protein C7C46_31480 [Streptomyces tateyamensis]|uniref:Uncharacterized protein n=1 Tax=Streptomyces tateyamensis TaxID=565073 RepID=A0A2V4NHA7_9ACTN|nr:hypothetical protein C7C46_31480 [Streptomyces tateyamensis]